MHRKERNIQDLLEAIKSTKSTNEPKWRKFYFQGIAFKWYHRVSAWCFWLRHFVIIIKVIAIYFIDLKKATLGAVPVNLGQIEIEKSKKNSNNHHLSLNWIDFSHEIFVHEKNLIQFPEPPFALSNSFLHFC